MQCLVDDKVHLVLVAAWGIPGSSYPDDAGRAMRAAHTLIGAVVNLSARLAQAAQGRVCCDEATARTFPIGKPMAAQRRAMQHWLHGRHAKALVGWQRALGALERTRALL